MSTRDKFASGKQHKGWTWIGDGEDREQVQPPGVKVERRFTLPDGPGPLDAVKWVKHNVLIKGADGSIVFKQDGVEAPESWSPNAVQITAHKYFRGTLGTPERESSVRQIITRVVDAIWRWGAEGGYFADENSARAFVAELLYMLVHQMFAFNSPVWFNIGVPGVPQQSSACFINSVEDSMESILGLAVTEGNIFRGGSGAGVNLSPLRSSKEGLTGGGMASGPVSFMRGYDAFAGAIKSGGKCLAPDQMVYTVEGPKTVRELAERGTDFIVLSYDPPAGRFKAKTARAWKATRKAVVKIVTDKGEFRVSFDHPVRLSTGSFVEAGSLQAGQSLFACSVDAPEGYLRVHLRDGQKGRELLHRLVARDVMGMNIKGLSVHHRDGNIHNNVPSNLEPKTQATHASEHAAEVVARGAHVFQTQRFARVGAANGMHRDGAFWQGSATEAYRATQGEILVKSGRAAQMQRLAAQQKMINTAFEVMTAGGTIDTFEGYVTGRKRVVGRIPSISKLRRVIDERFGSYEKFAEEVRANNHRVVNVELLGEMDTYDVEVDCPTEDDKSPASGHNFLIWSGTERTGSGVVVSNTRRAAKMVILNADHPDIMEFIDTKLNAEKMAHALVDAGWPADFTDQRSPYNWLPFQNANNSVRATDRFMQLATGEETGTWFLKHVTSNHVVAPAITPTAKEILDKIAEAAHFCADPGMQFDSTIQSWNMVPNTGRINATNPCSEHVFLDDTACNLGSLNLMEFLRADGTFDAPMFQHAARIAILAQEILVGNSDYPTDYIRDVTFELRPLGLGYANLGALLMVSGLPYDSDEARAYAGAITAVMNATAYHQSAIIARDHGGPFAEWQKNQKPGLAVLKMHKDNAESMTIAESYAHRQARELFALAADTYHDAQNIAVETGLRNAQVTVLAPTGTIGFMMDCDTTGVEPDADLVKMKLLVGGGSMKLVNQSVEPALKRLDYTEGFRNEITRYLEREGTLRGCSALRPEHLPVFASANEISWEGHIKMVAAVQPHLSGAVSKTINMPEDCTVEDVRRAYVLAWKLGLKAISIYRYGCKRSQPLSKVVVDDAKLRERERESWATLVKDATTCATCKKELKKTEPWVAAPDGKTLHHVGCFQQIAPSRRKLPKTRQGVIHKFRVGDHTGYMQIGEYPDGTFGEVFIDINKEGTIVSGLLGALGTAVSIGVQYGVPLKKFVDKFAFANFPPQGFTGDPDVPSASSLIDYVFRWLGVRYLEHAREAMPLPPESGEINPGEQFDPVVAKDAVGRAKQVVLNYVAQGMRSELALTSDTPPCPVCGTLMLRNGSCYKCSNCGETSGCS